RTSIALLQHFQEHLESKELQTAVSSIDDRVIQNQKALVASVASIDFPKDISHELIDQKALSNLARTIMIQHLGIRKVNDVRQLTRLFMLETIAAEYHSQELTREERVERTQAYVAKQLVPRFFAPQMRKTAVAFLAGDLVTQEIDNYYSGHADFTIPYWMEELQGLETLTALGRERELAAAMRFEKVRTDLPRSTAELGKGDPRKGKLLLEMSINKNLRQAKPSASIRSLLGEADYSAVDTRRHFQAGDDRRHIDWKASAKGDKVLLKQFERFVSRSQKSLEIAINITDLVPKMLPIDQQEKSKTVWRPTFVPDLGAEIPMEWIDPDELLKPPSWRKATYGSVIPAINDILAYAKKESIDVQISVWLNGNRLEVLDCKSPADTIYELLGMRIRTNIWRSGEDKDIKPPTYRRAPDFSELEGLGLRQRLQDPKAVPMLFLTVQRDLIEDSAVWQSPLIENFVKQGKGMILKV
ncbi:MAG: DUF58 domain-containing protein, partial [Bdellovibrionales bacterium]|nr:DUF58 domain-containing protein [Bdellovibrionales bacterium]